ALDSCGWIFAVTGGMYPGPALERRHRQAGVVRERPVLTEFAVVLGLLNGVREKGKTGFLDRRNTRGKSIEGPSRYLAQSRVNLDNLAGVRCCDDQASHVRDIPFLNDYENNRRQPSRIFFWISISSRIPRRPSSRS